ncbi:MAG: hypothetical protein E6600_14905 [Anaerocolumna aminovalerica]|jgi:hypothetical protein|uniref:hypothetical protein n=1 Tax=Anaerocolumna aminovalerica TaxID=1527 RepID=UPI000BE3897B|nr:hypothetical protein [Anaerocolumna aminovalerica]MBU5333436.1 hypothetical protein [Anaerocolumna aminovalerica]MDU6265782.1 hypothetical protein [Anaerocolumna aminovalerica]
MTKEELRRLKDIGPYDTSLEDTFIMYDEMPYVKDISICSTDSIVLYSGNIIKSFAYKIGEAKKIQY